MRSLLPVLLGLLLAAPPSGTPNTPASGGAASCAPLAAEPQVLWSFGPLDFEQAPLVAGEHVLAAGRDPTGRRALCVLDGASGRLLSRTLIASAQPLAVAWSGERVALRSAPNRVDVHRFRGARLVAERAFSASSLSAPLLEGDELYLREEGELARYALGQREPVWRARVEGAFRGTPALRDASLFAVWYEANGLAHLARLERASGQVVADAVLGRHRSLEVPPADAAIDVIAHASSVFVHLASAVPSTSGADLDWARVPFDGQRFTGRPTLHALLCEPLELGGGFVVAERGPDGPRWLRVQRTDADEHATELASSAHHAWLTACLAPASAAGDVLYIGPAAVAQGSLAVLWKRAAAPRFRPVPVDGGLLVIEGDVLRRLGSAPAAGDPAEERARALAEGGQRALGERLAPLASQAARTGDVELAARLLDEAGELGANPRALDLARSDLERQQSGARAPLIDVRKRDAVLAAERDAREALPEELAHAAQTSSDPREKRALLAELFRRSPDDATGLETLRALLPSGAARIPGAPDSWLDFLAVRAALPIELLTEPTGDGSKEAACLAEQSTSWREDVLAFESPRLFVVTAATAPGAVARALRAGELVCDVLASTFGGDRGAAARLELVLFPTRDEYLAHSGSDLGGLESALGWTAGHYDPAAEVSRIYLPENDEHEARLLGVYAHELTHHWLASRSRFGPLRSSEKAPGFWIVEAIATWAEELALDVERHSWSSALERSPSLDTVAAARAADLIPWKTLLRASNEDFAALERRPTCRLSLAWQLGAVAPRGPLQFFYAQGGALAQYLFCAEGGRFRDVLLRAVEGYYRGTPVDVCAALGIAPDDLGARVQAFARETVK